MSFKVRVAITVAFLVVATFALAGYPAIAGTLASLCAGVVAVS